MADWVTISSLATASGALAPGRSDLRVGDDRAQAVSFGAATG